MNPAKINFMSDSLKPKQVENMAQIVLSFKKRILMRNAMAPQYKTRIYLLNIPHIPVVSVLLCNTLEESKNCATSVPKSKPQRWSAGAFWGAFEWICAPVQMTKAVSCGKGCRITENRKWLNFLCILCSLLDTRYQKVFCELSLSVTHWQLRRETSCRHHSAAADRTSIR